VNKLRLANYEFIAHVIHLNKDITYGEILKCLHSWRGVKPKLTTYTNSITRTKRTYYAPSRYWGGVYLSRHNEFLGVDVNSKAIYGNISAYKGKLWTSIKKGRNTHYSLTTAGNKLVRKGITSMNDLMFNTKFKGKSTSQYATR